MKPEKDSIRLLGITRSKAKMIEYGVPEKYQEINLTVNPAKLFTLSIAILGDIAAASNRTNTSEQELSILRQDLAFSAHFFDSYLQSELNKDLDPYLVLLGSASYYLCNLPGSSQVLSSHLGDECPDLESEGLEDLLLWLLQGDLSTYFENWGGPFGPYIDSISTRLIQFFEKGTGIKELFELTNELRNTVYEIGTPRQLLLGDIIAAIVNKKYQNSSWYALPKYSNLTVRQWEEALQKENFIKELWPAQHLLGQAGILRGKSAVVQMPTSEGKTKATELIIRSAFLGEKTSLVIIVAPFRALCHEIKNSLFSAFVGEDVFVDELSDVLQHDFNIGELTENRQILVVTPEKLLYVLRQTPELAQHIGLLVLDEGHQFDSGTRGITYELLLTSLQLMIPEATQKILVSAVINNAEAIGKWLNGAESETVYGKNLMSTFRSVGFASWLDQLGQIKFIDNSDSDTDGFFVPRVLERFKLSLKPREKVQKVFPDRTDGKEIALFLGLKMVQNGSVAIFCGKPEIASNLCEKAVDIFERNVPLNTPAMVANAEEIARLEYLYEQNLGPDAECTKSARLGIFSHHGNTPHGIRLAVEHAMREGLIRFVICTSTLAQGVNLPIRYLIVTSVYQGGEQIKVRDFQNLIGRAGRSGMHTEGSIIFADPIVFDSRLDRRENWRWKKVNELLDSEKSEECVSSLSNLFPLLIKNDPSKAKNKKDHTLGWNILSFANAYIRGRDEIEKIENFIVKEHGEKGYTKDGLKRQFLYYENLLGSIESFLMSSLDIDGNEISEDEIFELAEATLAFNLADEENKEHIRGLFKILADNISKTTDLTHRKVYGKTLYGVNESQELDNWVQSNIDDLLSAKTAKDLLEVIWPILQNYVKNNTFKKCDDPNILKEVALLWLQGKPFHEMYGILSNAQLIWGTKRRQYKLDHVVEICEKGLSYDGSLLIGSIIELLGLSEQEVSETSIIRFQLFQKMLKYGLPMESAITLYELGFSDRALVLELSAIIGSTAGQKKVAISSLRQQRINANQILDKYPSYFRERLKEILTKKKK